MRNILRWAGWGRVVRAMAAVAVGSGVIWFLTFGSFEQEVRYSISGGFPLPEFTLPLLNAGFLEGDTTMVVSSDFVGEVVLMAFWATWCSPCIREQPSLLELQDKYGEDGLRVVGVLHRDDPEKALRFLEVNERLDLVTLVSTATYAQTLGVGALPHTLLIDREGQVVEVFGWYGDDLEPYLRRRVREVLRN